MSLDASWLQNARHGMRSSARSSSSSGQAVTVEQGQLLSLSGKRGKTVQYAIGLPEGSHGPYDKRAQTLRRAK
jgi:hypothetical protein